MTKEEVIPIMGEPVSTASPGGGVEILRYTLYNENPQKPLSIGRNTLSNSRKGKWLAMAV